MRSGQTSEYDEAINAIARMIIDKVSSVEEAYEAYEQLTTTHGRINKDVYSAFAMKNKNGINFFARLNGFQWTVLDSHDRLQGSIKHALTNISLKQKVVWYEEEYLNTHDEGVTVELEELAEEVYAALNAGGPTIDLENVSNEEKKMK